MLIFSILHMQVFKDELSISRQQEFLKTKETTTKVNWQHILLVPLVTDAIFNTMKLYGSSTNFPNQYMEK